MSYVITVMLITVLTVNLNVINPEWMHARLEKDVDLYNKWEKYESDPAYQTFKKRYTDAIASNKVLDPETLAYCDANKLYIEYYQQKQKWDEDKDNLFILPPAPTKTLLPFDSEPEGVREFQDQIKMLMQKDVDFDIVNLPLVGGAIDVNSMGLITGVAFLILLLLHGTFTLREADNMNRALEKAPDRSSLELLTMSQMFSQGGLSGKIYIGFTIFAPMFLDAWIVVWDGSTIDIANLIKGDGSGSWFLLWDIVSWILLLGASVM